MTVDQIITAISTCGFPIVCCGAMFYFINGVVKDLQKQLLENTQSITKLTTLCEELLRKVGDDDGEKGN